MVPSEQQPPQPVQSVEDSRFEVEQSVVLEMEFLESLDAVERSVLEQADVVVIKVQGFRCLWNRWNVNEVRPRTGHEETYAATGRGQRVGNG